jgi:hypothetical protein
MPYAMRFSANAPRAAFQYAVKNPRMFTPAGAAFLALPIMLEMMGSNFRFQNGEFQEKSQTPATEQCQAAAGWCQSYGAIPAGYMQCGGSTDYSSGGVQQDVCFSIAPIPENPPEVWIPADPARVPQLPPVIPEELPSLLPEPLPIDLPIINPSPGPNPQPQPLLIPTGDPVPVTPPATQPGQQPAPLEYKQPWIEVKPSPTVADPWRVTTRPVETTTHSPTAPTEPVTVPADPADPSAPTTTAPEKDPGLCALFPDILACKKLDAPAEEVIPKRDQDISLQTGPTFSGGSCPPDVVVSVAGQQVTVLSTAQPCDWISAYMKPIILLLASISAVFIVLPRGGD